MTIEETIHRLKLTLAQDPARLEFGPIEQQMLKMSMERCQLTELPEPSGDGSAERASGEMICEVCGEQYAVHPMDWGVPGYGNVPFLNILCDGRRVKL